MFCLTPEGLARALRVLFLVPLESLPEGLAGKLEHVQPIARFESASGLNPWLRDN